MDLKVRCACGTVRGIVRDVSPAVTNHVVCECGWCQRYAHVLERVDTMLDARGGTTVFQIRPSAFEVTDGLDAMKCIHLTSGGARRWYAGCCRTAIANTLKAPGPPFIGILACGVDWDGVDREAAIGPVRVRVNGVFDGVDRAALRARKIDLLGMVGHYGPTFVKWWVQGEGRRIVFFDPATGAPIVTPERVKTEPVRP